VAWPALHFSVVKEQIAIVVTLDAAKLKALPEYQESDRSVPVAVATKPKAKSSDRGSDAKAAP
jgi:hypothetical protein